MDVGILSKHTEADGALRVQLQDNWYSDIVELRLCQTINSIYLATDTVVNSKTISLNAGHGLVNGNIVCIKENQHFYQGVVTNVATNTITMDSPLDYAFTGNASCRRSSDAVNVDGSITPQVFFIRPPIGTKWDILGVSLNITDNSAMDDALFGGITALTNGVVIRRKDGDYKNIVNIKSNGEMYTRFDEVSYSSKAPSGSFGISGKKTFGNRHGISLRLDGSTGDELQVIVQDNLTALSGFSVLAFGHVVS